MDQYTITEELAVFLANLTSEPGVYRMMDKNRTVLYVGKAANLKKRVNSYFNPNHKGAKTRSLVSQIHSIEVSVTRSETEALLLESNLIKSLRPKYNVLMRDDKSYPYIAVSEHPFPKIDRIRSKRKPQKGQYFGPYPNTSSVRDTLIFIQKIFKIRNCSDVFFHARSRPCLQYQIKRCSAPCTHYVTAQEYQKSVQRAVQFLEGRSQQILDELAQQMEIAVSKLDFEQAAALRDQIKSLRAIQEQQGVAQLQGDADIIVLEASPGFSCVQCVSIRDGSVISSQNFFPKVPENSFDETEEDDLDLLWQQVFNAFISFYYVDTPSRIPAELVTNHAVTDQIALQHLLSDLRGGRCSIQTKAKRDNKRWLDFAMNNLELSVREHSSSLQSMNLRFKDLEILIRSCLSEVNRSSGKLQMRDTIEFTRLECFDISHTQGGDAIASCVVFNAKGPSPRDYRRFNIRGITPGDDYAAMEQAITRRFKRLATTENWPQLLIIDGGKGQVAVGERVLHALGVEGVIIIGIAKGPGRKPGFERLLIANSKQEIALAPDAPALHILQHIRDEAHRFAISAHRKKRQKTSLNSSLEHIEGVGSKRRQALMHRFGGQRELAKASVEEIAKVRGIGHDLALKIYNHFR